MRLGRGGVRVPEGDDDAATVEEIDELERAGQLWRECHETHTAGGQQPLEERRVGVAARCETMRPEPRG
jgi:hypothetical protein